MINKTISIRNFILMPFILFFVIFALLFSISNYFVIVNFISTRENHDATETNKRIGEHLNHFFSNISTIAHLNKERVQLGEFNINDLENLKQRFIVQVKHVPFINNLTFGSASGDFINVTRSPENQLINMASTTTKKEKIDIFEVNSQTMQRHFIGQKTFYDVRTRPWYTQAQNQKEMTWCPPYKHIMYKYYSISMSYPQYDSEGELLGVFNIGVDLDEIKRYIQTINPFKKGLIFIAEHNGHLIATSSSKTYDDTDERYELKNHPDPRINAIAPYLKTHTPTRITIEGESYLLVQEFIKNPSELHLIIGTLVAEQEYLDPIYQKFQIPLVLIVALFVFSILIIYFISNFLAKPIKALQYHANHSINHTEKPLEHKSFITEIQQLGESFKFMSLKVNQLINSLEEKIEQRTEQLKMANKKLSELSTKDPLTGLYNRRYLDEVFLRITNDARSHEKPLTLIMIDIDYFKEFNDMYGHLEGDICLKRIAHVLQQCTKHSGIACRYGGEEFLIVIEDISQEEASHTAHEILDTLKSLHIEHKHSQTGYVTVSLGIITRILTTNLSIDHLIYTADQALYRAKANGKNRIESA